MNRLYVFFFVLIISFRICAQTVSTEYLYTSHPAHAAFFLSINDIGGFEFKVQKSYSTSYSFGQIVRKDKKNFMKSQVRNFPIKAVYYKDDSLADGTVRFLPVVYKDSTIEAYAYLVIDGDISKQKYIDPRQGASIDSNFKKVVLQVNGKIFSQELEKKNIAGNIVSITIDTPVHIDNLLLVSDMYYFRVVDSKQIKMYDRNNKLLFTMEKVN